MLLTTRRATTTSLDLQDYNINGNNNSNTGTTTPRLSGVDLTLYPLRDPSLAAIVGTPMTLTAADARTYDSAACATSSPTTTARPSPTG